MAFVGAIRVGCVFLAIQKLLHGRLDAGHRAPNVDFQVLFRRPLGRQNAAVWLVAATDGSLHVLDGSSEQTLSARWGSDVASVKSNCGSGWQILATQPGVGSTDAVRAFEMPEQNLVQVSVPMEFAGPVTALWTEASGSGAIAVSKNAATGNYEAYRVSVACGQ